MKKDKNQNAYQEGFCFACSEKKIPAKIQKAYEKGKQWADYWMLGYNYGAERRPELRYSRK